MLSDITQPNKPRPKSKRLAPLAKPATTGVFKSSSSTSEPAKIVPKPVEPLEMPQPAATETAPELAEPVALLPETTKKRWLKLPKFTWPPTRKQQIIGGVLAVVLAFGIGAGWTLTHHKRSVVAVTTKKAAPKKVVKVPPVIYSTLSGLPVADASVNQKPVTAVMVENSLDARPQSGLGDAGVVFEAVAEGGVTRFMALYQDTAPTNVGPIRSARPYYIQWALGFDAAYGHVGGSPDALKDIKDWNVKDMNQFYNGGYYHRIATRDAPHNVYTGIDVLNQLESKDGYTSTFTGFTRKKEQPYVAPAPAPTPSTTTPTTTKTKAKVVPPPTDTRTPASSIDFGLSGYTYDPHYDYIAATNSYNRTEAGEAHTDANTGKQLSPKVVIAIVVPLSQGELDSSGAYYSNYNPLGTGQAYIFQDGTVTVGQWHKADSSSNISFTDANGAAFPLNPGQTWISAVTGGNKVTYK